MASVTRVFRDSPDREYAVLRDGVQAGSREERRAMELGGYAWVGRVRWQPGRVSCLVLPL